MTEASRQALAHLRSAADLQWYLVPLLAIAVYIYAVEVERRNWNAVFAGLALWGMDFLNEIANAVILHATGRSALWTTPGRTAYLILVGLNAEICFMFLIAGVVAAKMLPKDRARRVLGIPNRLFFALALSIFSVLVELVLNAGGLLVWEYSFWNVPNVALIVVFGYLHFYVVAFFVHDLARIRDKVAAVGGIFGLALAGALVFGVWLRWI